MKNETKHKNLHLKNFFDAENGHTMKKNVKSVDCFLHLICILQFAPKKVEEQIRKSKKLFCKILPHLCIFIFFLFFLKYFFL